MALTKYDLHTWFALLYLTTPVKSKKKRSPETANWEKKKKKKANTEKVVSFYFPLFQWSDLLHDWFAASSCCANIVKQRSFFSDN